MFKLLPLLKSWLCLVFAVTFSCGLVYLTVQQNYRLSANDPQIQIAQDVSVALTNGQSPTTMVSPTKMDMAQSLSPFLIIFDSSGNPVVSSAVLDGKIPGVPSGVFTYTKIAGQDRFTWQPRVGVRLATVVVSYKLGTTTGFVLVGRSLQEVERREDLLLIQVAAAWLAGVVGSTILTVFLFFLQTKLPKGAKR